MRAALWWAFLACAATAASDAAAAQAPLATDSTLSAAADDSLEQMTVDDGEGELESPRPQSGFRSRIAWRLAQARGYRDGTYQGSRLKSYQRLVLAASPHLSGALLATKDPGEPRLDEFVSANVLLSAGSASLLLGDYRLEIGQGLAFWRGYDFSKGGRVVAPAYRSPRMLLSSLSSDEIHFFRGAAARYRASGIDAVLFVSGRMLPGTIDSSGAHLSSSSLSRTATERARRNRVAERMAGAALEIGWSGSRAGVAAARSGTDPEFAGGTGEERTLSFWADLGISRARVFGEVTRADGSTGGEGGVLFLVPPGMRLIVSARSFPADFAAPHGLGFGERLGGSNETGVYAGIDQAASARWRWAAYIDRFWFPHPTGDDPFGAAGYDALLEVEYRPLLFRVQLKQAASSSGDVGLPGEAPSVSRHETAVRLRLQADYRLVRHVELRTRLEKLFLGTDPRGSLEHGVLFYHDIAASPADGLLVNVRLTFFASGSFASRLFAAERDLDGVLSLPALYGTGSRWYLLVRFRAMGRIACSFKYGETVRDDVRFIGAGEDRLPSNRDSQLGLQVDCAF